MADLTFPAGLLNTAVLWPGISQQTVAGYLTAFIRAGETKTAAWDAEERDAGTAAWAQYRALDSYLRDRVMEPSSVTFVDEGSASLTTAQLQMLADDRDALLAEFQALEVVATADDPYAFSTLRSLRD